ALGRHHNGSIIRHNTLKSGAFLWFPRDESRRLECAGFHGLEKVSANAGNVVADRAAPSSAAEMAREKGFWVTGDVS
ncbi:hypothetical protein ACLBYF_21815, partial [Methylobacterium brachiatum]